MKLITQLTQHNTINSVHTVALKIDYVAVSMTKVMSGGQLQLTMSNVEWQPPAPDLPQTAADVLTGYRDAAAVTG